MEPLFCELLLSMILLPRFFGYIVMSRWRKRYILLTRLYWAARKEEGSARAISCGCHNRALPALFADPLPPYPYPRNWAGRQYQDRPDWSQTLIQVPRTCACPKMFTCLIILCGPAPNIGRDIWVAM